MKSTSDSPWVMCLIPTNFGFSTNSSSCCSHSGLARSTQPTTPAIKSLLVGEPQHPAVLLDVVLRLHENGLVDSRPRQ